MLEYLGNGRLVVVVGGQYGSEAKGAVTGVLAARKPASHALAIRVAGPNAGHTVWDVPPGQDPEEGPVEYKLRHIPVAAVTNPGCRLRLAAGSEIDIEVLKKEVDLLTADGFPVRVGVSGQATLLSPVHRFAESNMPHGSTGEGVGAARAARAMRTASLASSLFPNPKFEGRIFQIYDLMGEVDGVLRHGGDVIVEGTQGYGLGSHAGHYPHCTSSDCRAIDMLAMAGISPWGLPKGTEFEVWVVFRPQPIRIAGNSGPLAGETTWAEMGLPDEYTTVTNKVRRVGEWDPILARRALEANGWPSNNVHVAMSHCDYLTGDLEEDLQSLESDLRQKIELIGTGPYTYRWR